MNINIDGGYLACEKVGIGIPILFIHGYPLSRKIWEPQLDGLSKQATVVTVDLRGHGESFAFDGPYSMDLFADDCKQVLDDLQVITPLVVCGLSMGGYVTMALYRKYPELFKGMILTSTRSGSDSIEGKMNRDASILKVREQGVSAVTIAMLPKMFSPLTYSTKPYLVDSIHTLMTYTSTQGIVGALQGMRDRPDSTHLLSQILCPVLIIHGADDQLIPINQAEIMDHQIPNSHLIKIPDAGHLVNMEQPYLFNQAVRDYIISID